MRPRIESLDGLRFLAALGVLWIHSWTYFGNPRLNIGGFDITNTLAIGGNGVDLFFVISGFCMYFFYGDKISFSYQDFSRFLFKRWIRLSPAFYIATLIYLFAGWLVNNQQTEILLKLGISALFLNAIFPHYNAAAHFWTLGTEWQFYLLIPFILIYEKKFGFKKAFCILFFMLVLLSIISLFAFKANIIDWLGNQILFRGIEFGWGVIVARLLLKNNVILIKYRPLYFFISVSITYIGRILISKQVLELLPTYIGLFKLFGFTLMGLGFACILYLSITSKNRLNKILSNRLFKNTGKLSYSFYLWHALMIPFCAMFIIKIVPTGIMAPILTTLLSTLLLYPISYISYILLEKPFLSVGNLTTK